jgi:hypothetical protein
MGSIRAVLRMVAVAAVLAFGAVLVSGSSSLVLADPRPVIVSVTMDDQNHAIVTWQKQDWQGSLNVWWSSGDGTAAAPGSPWNDHYGWPLVDCYAHANGDEVAGPNGTWLFGATCQGQDVRDADTSTTTKVVLAPGTYFFQVAVSGENADTGLACNYRDKSLPTECLSIHYSDVYRVTVSPLAAGTPAAGTGGPQPEPTLLPGATPSPREIDGPGGLDLPEGGGHVDVAEGGQATFNPPYNLDVEVGEIHFSEDLAIFHCPAWTVPYPPETTLGSWVGVRCRTVTTLQAGALIEGTDLDVVATQTVSRFYVFSGRIEVSDLVHRGVVAVGPGQMTTVANGQTPTAPVAFDTHAASLRWWDRPSDAEVAIVVALGVTGVMVLYFQPAILAWVLRLRSARQILAVNLFAGWTVIGWFVSLHLVYAGRQSGYPALAQPPPYAAPVAVTQVPAPRALTATPVILAGIVVVALVAGLAYFQLGPGASRASPSPAATPLPTPIPTPVATPIPAGITFSPSTLSCSTPVDWTITSVLPSSVHTGDTITTTLDGKSAVSVRLSSGGGTTQQADGSWVTVSTESAAQVQSECAGAGQDVFNQGLTFITPGTHTLQILDPDGKVLARGSYTVVAGPSPTPNLTSNPTLWGSITFKPSSISCSGPAVVSTMTAVLSASIPGSAIITPVDDGTPGAKESVDSAFQKQPDGSWLDSTTANSGDLCVQYRPGPHTIGFLDASGHLIAEGTFTVLP